MKLERSFGVMGLALMLSIQCLGQNAKQTATLRSILLKELRTTHNQAEWFVPINVAVEGVTAEQESWQPPGGSHSAGQITCHLLFWNHRNLAKFKGEANESYSGVNDETFEKFDSKRWSDTVKQFESYKAYGILIRA